MCLNEKRTLQERHCLCCFKINNDLLKTRPSKFFCSGFIPNKREDVESDLEKYPKKLIIRFFLKPIGTRIIIVLMFLAYLCFSIYGAINLKQGLSLYQLVSEKSYFYKYSHLDEQNFKTEPLVALCIKGEYNYVSDFSQDEIMNVISKGKRDENVDKNFEINWLTTYRKSLYYSNNSQENFIQGLKNFTKEFSQFNNDIAFNRDFSRIISSKFYLRAINIESTNTQGDLMLRLRELSETAKISCFFYTPAFIFYEQYVKIWPTTWQTIAVALAVMICITVIFMPHPLMVWVVFLTMVSILLGIFGFMYYWDLTLSSITMIHLVMSIGFSVDFSVHICHAFLAVRIEKNENALVKAFDKVGGPILNAAFSSLIGITMLAFTKSYIFQSFGKVMCLVILFGLFHAALVLPVFLNLLFPCYSKKQPKTPKHNDVPYRIKFLEPLQVLNLSDNIYRISKNLDLPHVTNCPRQMTVSQIDILQNEYPVGKHLCYSQIKIKIFSSNDRKHCCWEFA